MTKFILQVIPRTKKNHGQIVMRGKYPMMIPSKQYLQFEKECLPYLRKVRATIGEINYPINCECLFYMPTRRKVDLPNLLNAIDDAMVKAELLADDNRDIIAAHDGSRVYHDKHNPRIEITITKLEDYEQWKSTED